MKRSERHHLKENELATSVARAKETFEEKKREIIAGAIVVAAILGAVGGYFFWRSQVESASRAMLSEALAIADAPVVPPAAAPAPGSPAPSTPPPAPPPGSYQTEQAKLEAALGKFLAAADRYPSTTSGIAARYQAAATLAALGRNAEAMTRYKEVIERAGTASTATRAPRPREHRGASGAVRRLDRSLQRALGEERWEDSRRCRPDAAGPDLRDGGQERGRAARVPANRGRVPAIRLRASRAA
jgi:hypothetical protein